MPPFKYNPTPDEPAKIEYILPTKLENDKELADYFNYLKSISIEMGSITLNDLQPFYYLMNNYNPNSFSKEMVLKLFGFLIKSRDAEKFESKEEADKCIGSIEIYRTELGL